MEVPKYSEFGSGSKGMIREKLFVTPLIRGINVDLPESSFAKIMSQRTASQGEPCRAPVIEILPTLPLGSQSSGSGVLHRWKP